MKTLRNLIIFISLIISITHITLANRQQEVYFYISVEGNDNNTGTIDKPFASLAKAKGTVQKLLSNKMDSDITIYIKGGTYYLKETVVFGPKDCPDGNSKVTYKAYPGEKPIFSSGIKIKNWKKLTQPLPRLPQKAKDKVWVASVPSHLNNYIYSLYDESERLPRATSKGFFPTKKFKKPIEFIYEKDTVDDFDTIYFPEGTIKNWPNLEDAEILILPKWFWIINILGLKSVDEEKMIAKTNIPATYPLVALPGKKYVNKETCWVINMIDFLDEPGEWVYVSSQKKIYLWPKIGNPTGEIQVPYLKEFIRLEGNEEEKRFVKNLVFDGLTFTIGRRDTWTKNDMGLMSDWGMFDKSDALVRLKGAINCIIRNCNFINSSAGGIRLDLYCQKNKIIKNDFHNLGGIPILLCGYGPGRKDVNKKNEVLYNHIRNSGQIYWHSPAIFLWQSGSNHIANNLIHEMPYSGIVISSVRPEDFCKKNIGLRRECTPTIRFDETGSPEIHGLGALEDYKKILPFLHSKNNLIEKNEIHHVTQKLGDGNAIYLSGAGENNIIHQNYIHHLTAPCTQQAMRADDYMAGAVFSKNIIFNCIHAGISIKAKNHIENNIFVKLLDRDVSIGQDVELEGYVLIRGPADGSRIQKNIFYHQGGKQEIYEEGRAFFAIPPGKLKNCLVNNNIIYHTEAPKWSEGYLKKLQKMGIEKNSISADPMFINLAQENFELSENSPVWKLGFEKIELNEIGLRKKINR